MDPIITSFIVAVVIAIILFCLRFIFKSAKKMLFFISLITVVIIAVVKYLPSV